MSQFNKMYIWVEGPEDQDLFKKIKPLLLKKYKLVHIRERAQEPNKKINSIISVNINKGDDNLLVIDADFDSVFCISGKKSAAIRQFPSLTNNNILIIIKEIEGWYLAGLSDQACKKIGIKPIDNTDSVGKRKFDSIIPKKYSNKIDFMQEILKYFEVRVACQKSTSFNYFFNNFLQ